MPRIFLLNDNIDQDNWGAQATPYAIRRMLNDRLPDVEITSMRYGPMNTRYFESRLPSPGARYYTIGSNSTFRRLKYMLSHEVDFFPTLMDDFDFFGDLWDAGNGGPLADEFILEATASDLVLFNAENGIYRNARTGMRGLFMTWYAKTRLNRPAGVINQTARVSDMDRPIMKGITKTVYPLLDIVTAREHRSYQDLLTAGIENVKWTPDVVFYLREDEWEKDRPQYERWKATVGFDDRNPYFVLGASSLPMAIKRPGYSSPVADLVREIQKREAKAVLVAKDRGCLFLEDVARETGSIYFGPEHSFHELWPLLSKASFLVTGHFHYAIMAAQVGCPFVAMSTNNYKMEGVMEDLEWYTTRTYDSTALRYERDEVLAEVDHVIANRQQLGSQLRSRSIELGHESAKTAEMVSTLLNAPVLS